MQIAAFSASGWIRQGVAELRGEHETVAVAGHGRPDRAADSDVAEVRIEDVRAVAGAGHPAEDDRSRSADHALAVGQVLARRPAAAGRDVPGRRDACGETLTVRLD